MSTGMAIAKELSENTVNKIQQLQSKLKKYDSKMLELDQLGLAPASLSYNPLQLRRQITTLVSELVKPNMSAYEADHCVSTLSDRLFDLLTETSEKMLSDVKIITRELEEQVKTEKELRILSEEHQLDLEKQIDVLRNYKAQPRRNSSVSKSRSAISIRRNPSIEEYELQINSLEADKKNLQQEIERVQELYSQMVDSKAVLFFEKEHLKHELEDLTRELFEEANKMVSEESRLRAELESSNQQLSKELQKVLEAFGASVASQKERMSRRRESDNTDKAGSRLTMSESRCASGSFSNPLSPDSEYPPPTPIS